QRFSLSNEQWEPRSASPTKGGKKSSPNLGVLPVKNSSRACPVKSPRAGFHSKLFPATGLPSRGPDHSRLAGPAKNLRWPPSASPDAGPSPGKEHDDHSEFHPRPSGSHPGSWP